MAIYFLQNFNLPNSNKTYLQTIQYDDMSILKDWMTIEDLERLYNDKNNGNVELLEQYPIYHLISQHSNEHTIAEILEEFFKFYSTEFDYVRTVVSIKNYSKLLKVEKWKKPSFWRLSIEDPFGNNFIFIYIFNSSNM